MMAEIEAASADEVKQIQQEVQHKETSGDSRHERSSFFWSKEKLNVQIRVLTLFGLFYDRSYRKMRDCAWHARKQTKARLPQMNA